LQWQPGALLVVSADLPRLGVGDLEGMLALGRSAGTVVIAPDRGGAGTNALLLRPAAAIPFCFGLGSRARHAAEANERGYRVAVYEAEGTALDVDVPADLCLLEGARYASRP
jgi:2-phospho-L-lactate guanylyltransferase